MKELNRREFLTLTGAAVVALSLAGCGAPSAPSAPAAPTQKELELLNAINKVWKEKFAAGGFTHEQLTLNQDAVRAIRGYGRVFETVNETPHKFTDSDYAIAMQEATGLEEDILKKYGKDSLAGDAGIFEQSTDVVTLKYKYSCEGADVQAFVEELLANNSNSSKAEFISIYLPVVKNETYMTAVVFLNNKP